MEDDIETRRIVRIYSFEAEERLPPSSDAHALGRVLSEEEPSLEDITAPWRRFFEPWEAQDSESDPITSVISTEAAKLQKQWLEFQRLSPKEDQIDINTSEPTVDGVISMVAKIGKEWQSKREKGKRGKALAYFHRFCRTLDAHSNMLEVVPKGNEYVSIFTGTITSIIKASVKHEQIAEELGLALCIISEHVADCEVELELFRTEEMQRAVADLYAHIFLFLTDTLGWYMKKRRKRMLDSFNEKFMQEFELEIENIKRKSEIIKRKATQGASAEQRATRLTIEETRRDVRLGLEGMRREQAETNWYAQRFNQQFERERAEWQEEKKHLASLHGTLVKLLTDVANSHRLQDPNLLLVKGILEAKDASSSDPHFGTQMTRVTREELSLNSIDLEDFFFRDRIRLPCEPASPGMVAAEALAFLAEWTKSADIGIAAISGPDYEGDELEDPMPMLAAQFIDFAVRSNVPVVSYFCELRRARTKKLQDTKEMQGLIQLTYGIIRQLVEMMLPEFECDKDLSKRRFDRLDGSPRTWSEAVAVLQDLQELLPGKTFFVIDGLQWLDDSSTSEHLRHLVDSLRSDKLKVLFTTSGRSRCLLDRLSREEMLILDTPMRRNLSSSWDFEETEL